MPLKTEMNKQTLLTAALAISSIGDFAQAPAAATPTPASPAGSATAKPAEAKPAVVEAVAAPADL
jgi:hypothetical protein